MDFCVHKTPLTPANYSELTRLTSVVYDLQPTGIAYGVAEANHESIHAELSAQQLRFDSLFADEGDPVDCSCDCLLGLTCRVTNFLSAVSAFLDQTGHAAKRKMGAESNAYDEWTSARRNLYEERFSYRLLYQLRHYVQHYALPVSNIIVEGTRPEIGSNMVYEIGIRLQRDILLNGGFNWKHARTGIQSQPSEFDLLPLIDEHMNSIGILCRQYLENFRDGISECERYLDAFHRSYAVPKNAQAVVFVGESLNSDTPPGRQESIPVSQFRRIKTLLESLPSR